MKNLLYILFIALGIIPNVKAQEQFLGEIRIFAGNYAPKGWALCDGQLLPISQNTALFSILGTTYGGDGRSTFGLPDFRGAVALGLGNTNHDLGDMGGQDSHTITTAELPVHNHQVTLNASTSIATTVAPSDVNVFGVSKVEMNGVIYDVNNYAAASNTSPLIQDTTASGSSTPISIAQPTLQLNYIIALQGIFPPRN